MRFILVVRIVILVAVFQGTIVVVGSCISCTITASRVKYRFSLFNWNYQCDGWGKLRCLSEIFSEAVCEIIANFKVER